MSSVHLLRRLVPSKNRDCAAFSNLPGREIRCQLTFRRFFAWRPTDRYARRTVRAAANVISLCLLLSANASIEATRAHSAPRRRGRSCRPFRLHRPKVLDRQRHLRYHPGRRSCQLTVERDATVISRGESSFYSPLLFGLLKLYNTYSINVARCLHCGNKGHEPKPTSHPSALQ